MNTSIPLNNGNTTNIQPIPPNELEQYTLLASSPLTPASQRDAASSFLNQLSSAAAASSSDPQQRNASIQSYLHLLQYTTKEEVLFHGLTTLQRLLSGGSLDGHFRFELRTWILGTLLGANMSSGGMIPKYLRTKIGVVLALLIKFDYHPVPIATSGGGDQSSNSDWVQPFDDLINILLSATSDTSSSSPDVRKMMKEDIYLRTLHAMHDEIVDGASSTNDVNIKDIIRGLSVKFTDAATGEIKATPLVPVQQTISAKLISSLVSLLQLHRPYCLNESNVQQQQNEAIKIGQSIAIQSLNILSKFTSWIDLSLILNNVILSMLWDCFHHAGVGGDDVEADGNTKLSIAASHCFNELISRGMEGNGRKIDLLGRLGLFQELLQSQENNSTNGSGRRGVDLKTVDVTHIEAVIAVAELVNLAGIELLSDWDDNFISSSSCAFPPPADQGVFAVVTLLDQMMKVFFLCLSYDDIDVSGAVVPLAVRLTVTMGKEMDKCKAASGSTNGKENGNNNSSNSTLLSSLPFAASNHVPNLLSTLYIQMRYPADFDFDFEDDEDAEEELYRSELRKIYRRIVTLYPDLCLSFLGNALSSLPAPISTSPLPDMEASLRLLYHHCEGIRPPPGTKTILQNEMFRSLLVALHSSDVSKHSHREIIMLYYDISTRYSSLLKDYPHLMPPLLESMSGVRGLQHPHPKVRSRSCYLLLRLVKDMGQTMRPYVETAVGGIQGLISNPTALPIQPDDTLYLFETIGLLLGKTGLSIPEQRQYLTAVMTPHVQSINDILQSPNLQRDPEHYGSILSSSIAALAYLSKGFPKQIPPEVQEVLIETVNICLSVLQSLPGHEAVRNKCMVLLQRMIQCLREGVLPSMPAFLALLIEHCDAEDVLDVSQLLNQLCAKFGPTAVPALDAAMLPFLRKCHSLVPTASSGDDDIAKSGGVDGKSDDNSTIPPHLLTEQLVIKKLMFLFLQNVVSHGATSLLLSPTNLKTLEDVLKTMNDGATSEIHDPAVKKSCVVFFRGLIDQWAGEEVKGSEGGQQQSTPPLSSATRAGFLHFIYEVFLPSSIQCITRKSFNEKDAMQYRVVSEIGKTLAALKLKRGQLEWDEQFVSRIICSMMSAVAVPPAPSYPSSSDVIIAFRGASSTKEMEMCLKNMMSVLKNR